MGNLRICLSRLIFGMSASLFLCFLFTACASLPDVDHLLRATPEAAPPVPHIVGPGGPLSPQQSASLIGRLKLQTGHRNFLQRHLAFMGRMSGLPLVAGNKVTLLINGDVSYAAMLQAMREARDHINMETFVLGDDEVGHCFADLLLQKQAEGVQVNLIYDAYGCRDTPPAFFDRLRRGGINVLEFNPLNPFEPREPGPWDQRDHRKILIVDGRVGFTGGINIRMVYSEDILEEFSGKKLPWRDTDVQIEGPAVAELQRLFLETWAEQDGPMLTGRKYYPETGERGEDLVRIIGSSSGKMERLTYMMYLSAITSAEAYIYLTNAYFVPDDNILKALRGAAARGVDVRIVLPAHSEPEETVYAARYDYRRLLEAGVKLYERQDVILHAKTAVVDGIWSTVGSTNLDYWSLLRDNEVNAVILDPGFAEEMTKLFTLDLARSKQIDLKHWSNRPFHQRFREWFLHLFDYWL